MRLWHRFFSRFRQIIAALAPIACGTDCVLGTNSALEWSLKKKEAGDVGRVS